MHVNKTAQEFYQLFYGIHDNKLFLQIVSREGIIKYNFEGGSLKDGDRNERLLSIMNSAGDFFRPPFQFDEDFVLGTEYPHIIRREGERIVNGQIVICESFKGLPALTTSLYIESYLPFEKPLRTELEEIRMSE